MTTRYDFRRVADVDVFYREAGSRDAPAILLLHGFPTASHMFRDLIPLMEKPHFFITPGYGKRLLETLHYSQALRIGNRVEISGQGGWDDNFEFPETVEAEIAQAFRNVERTLATAGAGWEHVVHVNSYHVGGFLPEMSATAHTPVPIGVAQLKGKTHDQRSNP